MTPVDDLARRLAVRSARGSAADVIRAEAQDLPLQRIARAAATPVSRRRAFRLAAAAAGTSLFALRPGTAYAACPGCPQPNDPPTWTQFCGHPRGVGCLYVCCPPNFTCCQTDTVVTCCKPTDECGPIVNGGYTCRCKSENLCGTDAFGNLVCCEDECFEPPGADDAEDLICTPKCPPQEGFYQCTDEHGYPTGHCCDDEADEYCCGSGCCPDFSECCHGDTCCPGEYGCTDTPGVCGCREGQRCGDHCCGLGSVCCTINTGGTQLNVACCSATNLDELLDSIGNFFGARMGPGGHAGVARVGEAAASPGTADALVAIGAVADLAMLAHDRIASPPRDPAYRRAVRAPRIALRPIAAGPGLDAASAQALTRMLIAEARAWSLIHAAAVARARALTAIRAKNMKAARRQSLGSAAFAARAAKALRSVPRLRAAALTALQAAGTAEVSVTANQVRRFQNDVRMHGLPADRRARLRQIGLNAAQQRRVAKLLVARPGDARPAKVLLEPLADQSRAAALRRMATKLRRIAAASRRHPIRSHRPGPRTIRASRPHTSGSSGRGARRAH